LDAGAAGRLGGKAARRPGGPPVTASPVTVVDIVASLRRGVRHTGVDPCPSVFICGSHLTLAASRVVQCLICDIMSDASRVQTFISRQMVAVV